MTLHITGAHVGLGEAAEQQTHNVWDTLEGAVTAAAQKGFYPMDKPRYSCPELDPEELSHANSEQFAELITKFESWQSYAEGRLSELEGAINQRKNEMDIIKSDIKTLIRKEASEGKLKKKPPEDQMDDIVKSNPRWRTLLNELQQLEQQRDIIQSHYNRMGRSLRILSRSLEMRKIELAPKQTGLKRPW